MLYEVTRTEEEINAVLNETVENERKFPGQTYMEGVRAGIDWITG